MTKTNYAREFDDDLLSSLTNEALLELAERVVLDRPRRRHKPSGAHLQLVASNASIRRVEAFCSSRQFGLGGPRTLLRVVDEDDGARNYLHEHFPAGFSTTNLTWEMAEQLLIKGAGLSPGDAERILVNTHHLLLRPTPLSPEAYQVAYGNALETLLSELDTVSRRHLQPDGDEPPLDRLRDLHFAYLAFYRQWPVLQNLPHEGRISLEPDKRRALDYSFDALGSHLVELLFDVFSDAPLLTRLVGATRSDARHVRSTRESTLGHLRELIAGRGGGGQPEKPGLNAFMGALGHLNNPLQSQKHLRRALLRTVLIGLAGASGGLFEEDVGVGLMADLRPPGPPDEISQLYLLANELTGMTVLRAGQLLGLSSVAFKAVAQLDADALKMAEGWGTEDEC